MPLLLLALLLPAEPGLRVPDGFAVTTFADASLAPDCHCMTISADGRVLVAGRGYLRELLDTDGDGRADKSLDFAHPPKDGANGLCVVGDDVFAVGDGGLRLFRKGMTAEGRKKPSDLVFACRTGSEHLAHAVTRGPDGRMYLLVGDQTGVNAKHATMKGSPVTAPEGGCVLRFADDLKSQEIIAHGFRNAYGFDFDNEGNLFTFDSDNERCVSLPWYEPCRCYHVQVGGHHGWLSPQHATTFRRPPYWFDTVPPIATLGRGSPTGVVCYKDAQFPEKYRGGLFLLDWTFGVIHFVSLARDGSTFKGTPEVFLRSVGDNGFAPTAVAVDPTTGDLYVSIGGRGTRGAVYRVRHAAGLAARKAPPAPARAEVVRRPAPVVRRTALDDVRRLQLSLGDVGAKSARGTVREGYSRRGDGPIPPAVVALAKTFPTGNRLVDFEIARTLAMIETDDETMAKRILDKITPKSDVIDDMHYLICLSRFRSPRDATTTKRTASALLAIDAKLDAVKASRDRNWPLRIRELHADLAARDPALNAAILADKTFGRADHVVWTFAPKFDRAAAATRILETSAKGEFAWTADLVALIDTLPDAKSLPVLRRLYGEHGLDDAILPRLARRANADDIGKFLDGLGSARLDIVSACLGAMEKLTPPDALRPREALSLTRAVRLLPSGKTEDALRSRLLARLSKLAAVKLTSADEATSWLTKTYPDAAKSLGGADGVDVAAWENRLRSISWDKGDPSRGKLAYTKAACAGCHSGVAALGPDLAGVTGRFSRDDLFTAILRPSKDVSPRYRTTQLTTAAGKSYRGIIVYEAVDGILMLTGPGENVRLQANKIAERRLLAESLMPSGLLEKLRDDEVADLYAYLRTLGAKK